LYIEVDDFDLKVNSESGIDLTLKML